MLFIVIEHFRAGSAPKAYQRFNERGRLASNGLKTLGSWVTADLSRCFQVVEADDASSIQRWVGNWVDLIHFEILPVSVGGEVAPLFVERLRTRGPDPEGADLYF
jgi:hypothetical protein